MKADVIDPEIAALEPQTDGGDSSKLGQELLLKRAAGYTVAQLAVRYGLDQAMIRDLVQAAVDDNILAALEQEVLDYLLLKTVELDQQLAEMDAGLEPLVKRHYQSVGTVTLAGHIQGCPEDCDQDHTHIEACPDDCAKTHTRHLAVDLEEDHSNVAGKVSIIKERRQLLLAQKVLITARTNSHGNADEQSLISTIFKTLEQAARAGLEGDLVARPDERSREAGRLEAHAARAQILPVIDAQAIEGDPCEFQLRAGRINPG